MTLDLVIKNGKIVSEYGVVEGDIGIENGYITKIARSIDEKSEQKIDAAGKIVIPGGIDGHVHFQMMYSDGVFTADDFYTGTVAAACGGITTIIDFVTPVLNESFITAYRKRRGEADGKVVIDYGLHIIVNDASPERLKEVKTLAEEEGVSSVKVFTAYRKRGLMLDDGALLQVLRLAASKNILVLAHCENEDMINMLASKYLSEDRVSPIYHSMSRPDYVEAEAVQRMAFLTEITGAALLVVHLSSGLGLDKIKDFKSRGVKVFAETCPHYLVFTEDVYRRSDGRLYIMSPPLKLEHDRQQLWKGIADGSITILGSDHACFNRRAKERAERFTEIPGGVQGVENIIPILFSEGVKKNIIGLRRFVELVSTNPAKLYGLYPKKGIIAVNSQADLAVIDPNLRIKLGRETLHSNLDHSIYEGIEVTGYPIHVIHRGEVIVENRIFVGKEGRGTYIKRRKPLIIAEAT